MIPKLFVEFEEISIPGYANCITTMMPRFLEPVPFELKQEICDILDGFRGRPICEDVRGQAEEAVKGFLYGEVRGKRLGRDVEGWHWTPPSASLPG